MSLRGRSRQPRLGAQGDHALLEEGDAGGADADAAHLLAGRARPGEQVGDQLADLLQGAVGRIALPGAVDLALDIAAQIGDGTEHLAAAQVQAEHGVAIGVELQQVAGAPAGGLGIARPAHQVLVVEHIDQAHHGGHAHIQLAGDLGAGDRAALPDQIQDGRAVKAADQAGGCAALDHGLPLGVKANAGTYFLTERN